MQSIGHFKQKMQMKSGFNMDRCRLIIAGEELHEHDSAILYDARVSLRTSIFVKLDSQYELFNVLGSSSASSVSIPFKPKTSDIERNLKNNKNIPEGSYNCLLTFMYWFFVHRIVDQNKVSHQKQTKKRLPKAKEKLFPFISTRNLQDIYPNGAQTLSPIYFPDISSPKALPRVHHHIKSKKSPLNLLSSWLLQQLKVCNPAPQIQWPLIGTTPEWFYFLTFTTFLTNHKHHPLHGSRTI